MKPHNVSGTPTKRYRRCARMSTGRLLAQYLDHHALSPLTVELRVIDLLPGSEIQLPGRDRHDDLMMDQQALQMRVSIFLSSAMMAVLRIERSQALEPVINVLNQSALGIVDVDPRSDVH